MALDNTILGAMADPAVTAAVRQELVDAYGEGILRITERLKRDWLWARARPVREELVRQLSVLADYASENGGGFAEMILRTMCEEMSFEQLRAHIEMEKRTLEFEFVDTTAPAPMMPAPMIRTMTAAPANAHGNLSVNLVTIHEDGPMIDSSHAEAEEEALPGTPGEAG